MLRQPRFLVLACFLVAITSNFIQAAQISVTQTTVSERVLSGAPNAQQTDDLAFIVPDDDSDDTPVLILAQTTIENIQSAFLSLRLNVSTAVRATPVERHIVLRF